MSTPCRVIKDFGWIPTRYKGKVGDIVSPPAMLREIWIRRGFIEVFGEEAATKKEAANVPRDEKKKRGRPKKAVTV